MGVLSPEPIPAILLAHSGGPDRDRLTRFLSAATQPHYELRTVTDAPSAIALMRSGEIACVILDGELGGGDSSQVLDSVEARKRNGPPIIVQLAADSEEGVLKALNHGAQDYLVRGAFGLQGLFRCIRSVLERDAVTRERNQLIADLRHAIDLLHSMEGFHTVCAQCRKLRDEDGAWVPFETYIAKRTQAHFSHGICPSCARLLYGDVLDRFGDH